MLKLGLKSPVKWDLVHDFSRTQTTVSCPSNVPIKVEDHQSHKNVGEIHALGVFFFQSSQGLLDDDVLTKLELVASAVATHLQVNNRAGLLTITRRYSQVQSSYVPSAGVSYCSQRVFGCVYTD